MRKRIWKRQSDTNPEATLADIVQSAHENERGSDKRESKFQI